MPTNLMPEGSQPLQITLFKVTGRPDRTRDDIKRAIQSVLVKDIRCSVLLC
jgi:hypothetical protein